MTEPKPQWTWTYSECPNEFIIHRNKLPEFVVIGEDSAKIVCDKFNRLFSLESENRELRKSMHDNMQYYMEYCQRHGYVTPQDWLTNHKHF